MKTRLLALTMISAIVVGNINAETIDWNDSMKKKMTDGCVSGILEPAKRDFQERANQKGNADAVFPEDKIKQSVVDLCACITQRASTSWSYQQFIQQPELVQRLVSEAVTGGECKRTGMLGKSMGY